MLKNWLTNGGLKLRLKMWLENIFVVTEKNNSPPKEGHGCENRITMKSEMLMELKVEEWMKVST